MDAELKDLLGKVLANLDGMEARLKKVEAQAHEQVTIEELERRASEYRLPKVREFQWLQAHTQPLDWTKVQTIC